MASLSEKHARRHTPGLGAAPEELKVKLLLLGALHSQPALPLVDPQGSPAPRALTPGEGEAWSSLSALRTQSWASNCQE